MSNIDLRNKLKVMLGLDAKVRLESPRLQVGKNVFKDCS